MTRISRPTFLSEPRSDTSTHACLECSGRIKTFLGKGPFALERHARGVHARRRRTSCILCDHSTFQGSSEVEAHVWSEHQAQLLETGGRSIDYVVTGDEDTPLLKEDVKELTRLLFPTYFEENPRVGKKKGAAGK